MNTLCITHFYSFICGFANNDAIYPKIIAAATPAARCRSAGDRSAISSAPAGIGATSRRCPRPQPQPPPRGPPDSPPTRRTIRTAE